MLTLIQGGEVYAPHRLGVKDILVAGRTIARVADRIELPQALGAQFLQAGGKLVVPGLIDLHVHILGGGGEGGPRTRAPEITLSRIARAGVTTVVGCLGTDDVSRRPETLLAKAMQLEEEGVSTYIYAGSYQLPAATITGSLRKDIALIPKVIGVGELAISDHRSSQPCFEELCRVAAQARVGGMLGGKAGLVHVHVGAGPGGLEPLVRIVRETEIPIEQFLPTHVTRNRAVLDQAVAFGKMGGNLDMTAKGEDPSASPGTAEALALALECGVALDQLTVSSDANGSLPRFNAQGMLTGLSLARIESLWEECRRLVRHGFPLEDVLRLVTRNPAHRAGITQAKGGIEEGKDADLLLLTGSLEIDVTMAKGRVLVRGGASLVKGTFEE